MKKITTLAVGAASLLAATPAFAAITLFQSYVGSYGLSTDGGGSNAAGDYMVSASVPLGAVVTNAYLYQATLGSNASQPMTLNGSPVTFNTFVPNGTACCSLASSRADVTGLVSGIINGGAGGVYDFLVNEGNTGATDGSALVVVYSLASLATSTVAILDGFASVTGDTTLINFAKALDPTAAGFTADLRLGIGFSCCNTQRSTVNVNGALLTDNAGNNDDGLGTISNGQLITVGGFDDPYSPALPSYIDDHERYDLTSFITKGDTQIKLDTFNSSQDDNIFLIAGVFSGVAGVNQPPPGVPEPTTWALMILGFGMIGTALRRRQQKATLSYAF